MGENDIDAFGSQLISFGESYQKRLDHIDNEVFYGRMSVQEELAALEELQKQYEVGSEKYLEIDKMIYSKLRSSEPSLYCFWSCSQPASSSLMEISL